MPHEKTKNDLARDIPLNKEQQKLVADHVLYAYKLALRYANPRPWLWSYKADLKQCAVLGLIRAAQGFDMARGNKFVTYATWWIRESLARGSKGLFAFGDSADEEQFYDQHVGDDPRNTFGNTENELAAKEYWSQAVRGITSQMPKTYKHRTGVTAARNTSSYERNAELFLVARFDVESENQTAKKSGLSRERIRQIVDKVEPAFQAWAAKERENAA